jgi:hypothetical protein
MDANAPVFVPAKVKAVIRYILNPRSPLFNMADLVPTVTTEEMVLYRGQCGQSDKKIPRLGNNPLEISLAYGRPISTSAQLSPAIWKFACKPEGRLFEIHVTRGVTVYILSKSLEKADLSRDVFQFIKDELPADSGYKNRSVAQIRAAFFKKLAEEKEVLLDPNSGIFKKESGEIEDWTSDEVARGDKTVYVTGFFPKKAGRRRATRRQRRKVTRRH